MALIEERRRRVQAGAAGFKRVEAVHLGAGTATATGVLHRYPRTVRISLHTAARLIAAGVPVRPTPGREV